MLSCAQDSGQRSKELCVRNWHQQVSLHLLEFKQAAAMQDNASSEEVQRLQNEVARLDHNVQQVYAANATYNQHSHEIEAHVLDLLYKLRGHRNFYENARW